MTLRPPFLPSRGLVAAAGRGVGVLQFAATVTRAAHERPSGSREADADTAPLSAALQALAQAAEAPHAGRVQAAIHVVDGDGLRTLACGSAPPAMCEAIDVLPDAQSPARRALHIGAPVVLDLTRADTTAHWPACAELLRRHGFAACCALPLSASGGRPLAVWMLYGRQAPLVADEALASLLSRPAALLIEQAQHQRQREHEAQARRDTLRSLAHDMRNLLAPLRTALEVLGRPQPDGAAPQRLQAIIGRQLAQLATLPDELSRLARTPDDEAAADAAQLPLPADELRDLAPAGAPAVAGGAQRTTGLRPAPRTDGAVEASRDPSRAADGADADGRDSGVDHTAPAPRRVLVADDNEMVRDSFVELLAAEGFEVRTAADGVQAVEIADQWRPDVVLLDIHMPRLSGLETARRLRAAHPPQAMTLLMLSGMALNEAWVRHAKAAGFDDCLDKSDDPRAWLARLRGRSAPH